MPHPPLRGLDIYPVEERGETVFLAQDPRGVLQGYAVLPMLYFAVAVFLDGKRGSAEIQEQISKRFPGALIPLEKIDEIVGRMDEALLLESPRFQAAWEKMLREFSQEARRPAYHAGRSYAPARKDLENQIKGYYESVGGAGLPAERGEGVVAGILAPHIDFQRGGACYTYAYRRIAEACDADLFVILGVAHSSPPSPFVLTAKDYETPLGTAPTDAEFVERFAKRSGDGLFEHEIVHRTEHSAEFQAVFLRHSVGDRPYRVVPILCSSFEPYCPDKSPSAVPMIEERLQALAETIRESGRKVCLVGGVDFAHIGPRFGDPRPVTPQLIKWMEREDEASLEKIEQGDAEGFWLSVMSDGNRRKVCGLTAVYTALRVLQLTGGPAKGKLLKYGHAPDPAGGIVSFASVEFTRK